MIFSKRGCCFFSPENSYLTFLEVWVKNLNICKVEVYKLIKRVPKNIQVPNVQLIK